jgi:hypothetical protein
VFILQRHRDHSSAEKSSLAFGQCQNGGSHDAGGRDRGASAEPADGSDRSNVRARLEARDHGPNPHPGGGHQGGCGLHGRGCENYGIVAPAPPPGDVAISEQEALSAHPVKVTVFKAGATVALDSRRGAGDWEQLLIMTSATYSGARTPETPGEPEVREYRCQAYEDNQRVGPVSTVASVVTTPWVPSPLGLRPTSRWQEGCRRGLI